MPSEPASKRRGWLIRSKIETTTRAMAALLSKKKKSTPLTIPDNLSSTGACAAEPLHGDEPVEAEPEQLVLRRAPLAAQTKKWRFPQHLHLLRNNVFGKPEVKSKPRSLDYKTKKITAQNLLTGVLRLPTEVRNQIYGYIFHQRLVTIKQNDAWPYHMDSPLANAITEYREPGLPKAIKSIRIVDTPKKTLADLERKLKKARGVSYDRIPGQTPLSIEGVRWETSMSSLLLTCKHFNAEAAPILYGTTAFYFDDAQRLRAFLKTVSRINLACITRLHVHVRAYGIPTKAADDIWYREHIECWTSIFETIAKKMTNLRAMRVTLSMRSLTDGLKHAFKPVRYNTDWKERAGYMLMLKPLSSLSMLKDLRVSIKATDHHMQLFQQLLPHIIYKYWALANVQPMLHLQVRLQALHQQYFEAMHHGLERAMKAVARSEKVDESFIPVAIATSQYMDFMLDPVGSMLYLDYQKKEKEKKEKEEIEKKANL